MLLLTPTDQMLQTIPDPQTIRQLIGTRSTELTLLRRLLKLAEDRARVQSRMQQPAPVTAADPAHGR